MDTLWQTNSDWLLFYRLLEQFLFYRWINIAGNDFVHHIWAVLSTQSILVVFRREKVRWYGFTLSLQKPLLSQTLFVYLTFVSVCGVCRGAQLCVLHPWRGRVTSLDESQDSVTYCRALACWRMHRLGVCMVKEQHGCDLSAQQGIAPQDHRCQ